MGSSVGVMTNFESCSSFDEVLFKNIVQAWVQLLLHIFNQQRIAQREAVFQVTAEELVVEVGHLHLSLCLFVLDPRFSLPLYI